MKNYTVFLGEVALDEYYESEHWPALGDKAIVRALPPEVGGTMANAASVFRSFGEKTGFVTTLNSGSVTKILVDNLEGQGIDTKVIYDDSLPDCKTMVFVVGGENSILIPTMGIEKVELTDEIYDFLKNAQYIYSTVGEISLLRYKDMGAKEVVASFKECGVKMVYDMDVGYINPVFKELYKQMDIAFFNNVGFDRFRGNREVADAALSLLAYGISVLVVTKGAQGSDIYTEDGKFSVAAPPVTVLDVTGAGDSYCSAFLHKIIQGATVQEAATFATATASICVSAVGPRSGAVGSERVEEFIREQIESGFNFVSK